MKKTILAIAFGAVMAAGAANAGPYSADVTNDAYNGNVVNGTPTANMTGGNNLYDAGNTLLGAGTFSRNSDLDSRLVENDEIWKLSSSPGYIVLIGLSAGYSNTAGIYTDLGVGTGQTSVLGPYSGELIHAGDFDDPFPVANIAVAGNFGWYLNSVWDTGTSTWFSESSLNADGFDHLMTFDMSDIAGEMYYVDFNDGKGSVQVSFSSAFMLGWEDLPLVGEGYLSDDDYNDMMYLVASVATTQVPEPGILGIFGFGLAALGFMTRRRRRALA